MPPTAYWARARPLRWGFIPGYLAEEAETIADAPDRQLVPITSAEVLPLLGTVRIGRIAYMHRALPSVQAVSHMIDNGSIIIKTHGRPPAISPAGSGTAILAYEADAIDPETFSGWRVTVTGQATLVRDHEQIARYQQVLPPWPSSGQGQYIRLQPSILTGYRFLGLAQQPSP